MRIYRHKNGVWLAKFTMNGTPRLFADGKSLLRLLTAISKHWYVETVYGGWSLRK